MELRIILWEDDAQYLNVVLPAFFTAPNDAIREMFLEVVNGVSQTTKISKVFFRGNELWAAAGTFVPNPEAGCAVLAHCIEDLELALRKFSESADMFLSMARK
jgi:hypothetical protein